MGPSMSNAEESGLELNRQEQCRRYVERALGRNPWLESEAIIRGHNRLLGLVDPVSRRAEDDSCRQRDELLRHLTTVRAEFWSMPLPALNESLNALDACEFPDIRAAVGRLTKVKNERDRIPTLASHKAFDPDFFRVFREVLTAAPRDSAIAKERMLAQFGSRKVRRPGRKMIHLIKQQLPELYELEHRWLNALLKQKGGHFVVTSRHHRSQSSRDGLDRARQGFNVPWWAIILGIMLLRAIVASSN
jgi:hypothetical protein